MSLATFILAAAYLLIGAVVGNALVCQLDYDRETVAVRVRKIATFLFGLVFWPVVLLYGLVELVHALTYSGPF